MRFFVFLLFGVCSMCSVAAEEPKYPSDVITRRNGAADTSSSATSKTSTQSTTLRVSPPPTSSARPSSSPPSRTPISPTHSATSASSAASLPPVTPIASIPAVSGGLTRQARIAVGVGVPLGIAAIAGVIAAYIIGKRRGRRRRVDDPTAGAGKYVRDPSDELNIPRFTPPAVAELSSVRSNEWDGPQKNGATWWKSFGRTGSAKNHGQMVALNAPQSPQELPA